MMTPTSRTATLPANGDQLVELSAPPKPPLAFRVGAVGHRPNRLQEADAHRLGRIISQILQTIQESVVAFARDNKALFSPGLPALRVVSTLAEGTDRLFVEQALGLGYELCCVMPFHQEEFEKDFQPGVALEPDSLVRFRSLLQRAADANRLSRFQLDGNRANEATAYGLGGHVVLNQSDLLIAVWDGTRQGKRGGTEEMLDEARLHGIPMIWIDAHAPHAWQLLHSSSLLPDTSCERAMPDGSGTSETIRQVVRDLLDVPKPHAPEGQKDVHDQARVPRRNLELYYAEKARRNWAPLWKAFQYIAAGSSFPEKAIIEQWPLNEGTPTAAMVIQLRPFYAWPDKLSVLYSDRYRSTFLLVFLLAAASVAMALAPVGWQVLSLRSRAQICTFLESAAIAVAFLVVLLGRAGRWHERWIDYRLAAELIRHLRIMMPVGGGRPFPQVQAHHAIYGHPTATWMDWYARAVARSIGLPSARLDRAYLNASLLHLESLLTGQLKYHQSNARQSWALEHRLHIGIVTLFALTFIACILHLLHIPLPGNILTFFCGFFPALGAALAGINNHGEFRRVAKRSEAMQEQLRSLLDRSVKLRERVASVSEGALAFDASGIAGDFAHLLVTEVLDWRVVFLDRPLEVGP